MPQNSNYEFGAIPPDLLGYVKNKQQSSKYYFEYFLARTKRMFQYKDLPDTIDASILERYLQVNGVCCITEHKGSLYAFNGSLGGAQDIYYRPTLFVVSNPHFGDTFSKEIVISSQLSDFNKQPTDSQPGILMRNDSEWIGLSPLIARYSVMLAENLLTIRSADVMLRIIALITASSDKSYKSAVAYLNKLEKGEFGAISDDSFSENQINMQSPPSNNGSYLTQFIELHQYLIGSFFNELGLRANYNMKREAIGEGESSMDEDAILPLCDDMLLARKQDIQKVNDMYGTNISVEFSSAWLENKLQRNITLLSQLSDAGIGQVGDSEDDMGQLGSTEVDSETGGKNEGDGTEVISHNNATERIGEDVLSGADGGETEGSDKSSKSTGGKSGGPEETTDEESGDSGEGEGDESADNNGSDGSNSGGGRSEINDIVTDDVLEKIADHLDNIDITEKTEPDLSQLMEGGNEDGFLGETEGSGNEDDNSDN